MTVNVSEVQKWELHSQNTWNEVELLLFEKLTTESIKGKDKYMSGKLTTGKIVSRRIFIMKTFHKICIATQ